MSQINDIYLELSDIVGIENIGKNVLMKEHTSFKVGGPVDILVTPTSYDDVISVIKYCNKNNITYFAMGNGSNLVVKDGGIRGIVIKFSKLNKILKDGEKITAQAGATLREVSDATLENCLTGFEFASGIPGSVGGAAAMNAGAYDGRMDEIVESVLVIDNNCNIIRLNNEQLEFAHRDSIILKKGYIVLEVTYKLKSGEKSQIKSRIEELDKLRSEKQPLEYPSAGSIFKRPEGYFTAKLIQDCGLKGVNVGGAQVSQKHSGFIINKGEATAKDILNLIELVQKKVKEQFGVEIHTEVRIIGEDVEKTES